MRVFVAGASGILGRRLVPQLIDAGHEVIGTHNSPASAEVLRSLGAKPVLLDLLDERAVREAVLESEPEAIVHEATALANAKFGRSLDKMFARTNALRTRGTDALLAAAWEAGVRRFVAQSFAPYRYVREGGPVKTEDDPLDPTPPAERRARPSPRWPTSTRRSPASAGSRCATAPSTAPPTTADRPVRQRQFPIVGDGTGVISWIHLDDAAAATVLALDHDGPAIFNIVDDDPAPVREWLPALAEILGAKPPRRFPAWLARLVAGEAAVVMGTEARGASNAKAKRELGWTPRYPSWRRGSRPPTRDQRGRTADASRDPADEPFAQLNAARWHSIWPPRRRQASGSGAPRSDSGRGPKMRRSASSIAHVVDARLAAPHVALVVELPLLVAVAAPPLAGASRLSYWKRTAIRLSVNAHRSLRSA